MRLEQFLFCEMARDEPNGQLTLIGVYPGNLVMLQLPAEIPLQLSNLYAVVILGDMDRTRSLQHQCDVKHEGHDIIITPSQRIPRPAPPPAFQTLIYGYSPFPCTRGPGDYEFRVTVQPEAAPHPTTFAKRFTIKRLNPPAPTTPH